MTPSATSAAPRTELEISGFGCGTTVDAVTDAGVATP